MEKIGGMVIRSCERAIISSGRGVEVMTKIWKLAGKPENSFPIQTPGIYKKKFSENVLEYYLQNNQKDDKSKLFFIIF